MDARQMYEKWLRDFAQDPDLVRELTAIAGDDKEIEDRFYRELEFGTAGMRGVHRPWHQPHERATPSAARRRALADVHQRRSRAAPQRGVAIAYDSRRFSQEFALETALGPRCANGVKVYLYESPAARARALLHGAGTCTASPAWSSPPATTPSKYNGYKVYWEDGGQLPPERAAIIDRCSPISTRIDYGSAKPMDEKAAKRHRAAARSSARRSTTPTSPRVRALCVQPRALTREMGKTMQHRLYARCTAPATCPCAACSRRSALRTSSSCPSRSCPTPTSRPWAPRRTPRNYVGL